MLLSDNAESLGNVFAQLVIDEDWQALSQCFCEPASVTAEMLAVQLAWPTLSRQIAEAFEAETGAEGPELDAPKSYEVYNDVCRDNDYGVEPFLKLGDCSATNDDGEGPFIEIEFAPDSSSGFDNCYRCILSIVDSSQPKVAGIEIELILD